MDFGDGRHGHPVEHHRHVHLLKLLVVPDARIVVAASMQAATVEAQDVVGMFLGRCHKTTNQVRGRQEIVVEEKHVIAAVLGQVAEYGPKSATETVGQSTGGKGYDDGS